MSVRHADSPGHSARPLRTDRAADERESSGAGPAADRLIALQHNAGNRAVAGLLAVQRAPADAAALFGASDVLDGPPIGTANAETMGAAEVAAETADLRRWSGKQTQSSTRDNDVQFRLGELERRAHQLGTPVPAKHGHTKPSTAAPKPRALDADFDARGLSDQDAAAEYDHLVEYLRTSPPKSERQRLALARSMLEEKLQIAQNTRDETVRADDIRVALTSTKGDTYQQMRDVLGKIESIEPDPQQPGQWIIVVAGTAVPVADAEAQSIRAAAKREIDKVCLEASNMMDDAEVAYRARRDTNAEHTVVHRLVKFATGVDDIPADYVPARKALGASMWDQASTAAGNHQYVLAFDHAQAYAQAAEGVRRKIGTWEDDLVGGAKRWVIGLTVLKEGLTILATAGAAGLTTSMVKGGASFGRAALTVGGATTGAGMFGAAGGETVHELADGRGLDAGRIFTAGRQGAAAGAKIGVTPGAVGAAKEIAGVTEGVATVANVGKAVAAEWTAGTAVNVGGALVGGTSVTDELKGSVASPISTVGGAAVGQLANGSKVITAVGGAAVGGVANTAAALAQGKSGTDLAISAGSGVVGGGLTPKLAEDTFNHNTIGGPLGPAGRPVTTGEDPSGAEPPAPITDIELGPAGRPDLMANGAGSPAAGRTLLGMGAAGPVGPAGPDAGPATLVGMDTLTQFGPATAAADHAAAAPAGPVTGAAAAESMVGMATVGTHHVEAGVRLPLPGTDGPPRVAWTSDDPVAIHNVFDALSDAGSVHAGIGPRMTTGAETMTAWQAIGGEGAPPGAWLDQYGRLVVDQEVFLSAPDPAPRGHVDLGPDLGKARVQQPVDDIAHAAAIFQAQSDAVGQGVRPPSFTRDAELYQTHWEQAGGEGPAPAAWLDQYGRIHIDLTRVPLGRLRGPD